MYEKELTKVRTYGGPFDAKKLMGWPSQMAVKRMSIECGGGVVSRILPARPKEVQREKCKGTLDRMGEVVVENGTGRTKRAGEGSWWPVLKCSFY